MPVMTQTSIVLKATECRGLESDLLENSRPYGLRLHSQDFGNMLETPPRTHNRASEIFGS